MPARRHKSLTHGVKQVASPYEPWVLKTSPFHREHRSKKGRRKKSKNLYKLALQFKRKKETLLLKELDKDMKDYG